MEVLLKGDELNRSIFCIYSLVKVWNSINIIYELPSNKLVLTKFKKYLYLNEHNSREYDNLIQNTFSLIDNGINDYYQTYLYLRDRTNICDDFINNKNNYLIEFASIIKKFISYFEDNRQCQLFTMTNFIKNEISECFYEMYSLFRISSPKQAQICLEKSCNVRNYKAHFELGLIKLREGDYPSAYGYFFNCSEFLITKPLEICYPPSMLMIGIMYYHGLYVMKDLHMFKTIYETCSQMNQCHPDNNFKRAEDYLPETITS